jgi:hypothetical protein
MEFDKEVSIKEIKENGIYIVRNLDVPISHSKRCTMIYGREVKSVLIANKWLNFEIIEVNSDAKDVQGLESQSGCSKCSVPVRGGASSNPGH